MTLGLDGTTKLWRSEGLEQIATLMHASHDATFSAEGTYLATGGADGKVRLWQVSTGRKVARLEHRSAVLAVVFTADGRYLTSVSNDARARTWFVRPADLVAEACARLTRNLTRREWRQYVGDEPYAATCSNLAIPAEESTP